MSERHCLREEGEGLQWMMNASVNISLHVHMQGCEYTPTIVRIHAYNYVSMQRKAWIQIHMYITHTNKKLIN